MLFSQSDVVAQVERDFEPVWQTVRPVPLFTVDFGGGRTVRRTLHGNIATYVIAPDGLVVDVIPGLYAPAVYQARLEEARRLTQALERVPAGKRGGALAWYHARRLQALEGGEATLADTGQGGMQSAGGIPVREARLLWDDARLNEARRRRKVEALLARAGATGPEAITNAVYRDVLGVDLADPLLGLGGALGPDPLRDP